MAIPTSEMCDHSTVKVKIYCDHNCDILTEVEEVR